MRESAIALAMNFPRNLKCLQISSTTLKLVPTPRGAGDYTQQHSKIYNYYSTVWYSAA